MKVLRMTDRVHLDISDIKVTLKPLTRHERTKIASQSDQYEMFTKAIQYSIVDIKGLKEYGDVDYKLEFEGEYISDDCLDEILNTQLNNKLLTACSLLLQNNLDVLKDPITDEAIEGIKLTKIQKKENKEKNE